MNNNTTSQSQAAQPSDRAAFEAWAGPNSFYLKEMPEKNKRGPASVYYNERTQHAWEGWQACAHLAGQSQATLEDSEQYRQQIAGISCASFGYWKEGDSIHPDYDTVPLRDVAKLYAKYEALYESQATRAVPDLHNAIMNLPAKHAEDFYASTSLAYKCGHRDARHAAAALVNEAEAAQEVTQQAAKAETAEQANDPDIKTWPERIYLQHQFEYVPAFEVAQKACAEITWCQDNIDRYDIEYVRSDLAPTTSTVSAPEEVRNQALEEAAQIADAEYAEFLPKAGDNNGRESDFAFGSVNSAERIANAIRALRTTSSKGEAA